MKLPWLMMAVALAGCNNRTQAQRDHQMVNGSINGLLGKGSPYGPELRLIGLHRVKSRPSLICGYWDRWNSNAPNIYIPFAVEADGSWAIVYDVGDNWLDGSPPRDSQRSFIHDACGKDFVIPGFPEGTFK